MSWRALGTARTAVLIAAAVLVFTAAVHCSHRHRVETCAACLIAAGGAFLPAEIPAAPRLLVVGILPLVAVLNPSGVVPAPYLVRAPPQ